MTEKAKKEPVGISLLGTTNRQKSLSFSSLLSLSLSLSVARGGRQWDPSDQVLPQRSQDPPRGSLEGEQEAKGEKKVGSRRESLIFHPVVDLQFFRASPALIFLSWDLL